MEHIDKMNKALRKWSCTQCTYKNWPTVKMCTMCRALRTSRHDQPNDDTSGNLALLFVNIKANISHSLYYKCLFDSSKY